jgi:MYXO-CTERM domain-containing protein
MLPASAQNAGDSRGSVDTRSDEGFDMGWLGLIGLAGLLGLRRRDDAHGTLKGANR